MRLRSDGVTWQEIDGELVILDMQSSAYLTVNAAGTALAKLLVEGSTPEAMAAALVEQFDIDESTAREDTASFVAQLVERGLLLDGE
jgi:hypothetical protein